MRQKLVIGNWKMYGRLPQVIALTEALCALPSPSPSVQVAVLVPSIYISKVSDILKGEPTAFGAQNVYPKELGPYTGEISGPMLKDYHCRYVLVGHSERRQLFHEDEKFIAEKFHHVKEHDMIPILCVGETQAQRQSGLTEQILAQQLSAVFKTGPSDGLKNCIIAYEPVWAIGTGKTATPEQAQSVHVFIREFLSQFGPEDANVLPIIYGGSVNEKNAKALFEMADIDGGLVGGASLHAQQFGDIVTCINCC